MVVGSTHSVKVGAQLLTPAGMAELPQRLRLDLADPLAGDAKLLPNFLERSGMTVVKTKAKLEHPALAIGQRRQHAVYLLLQQLLGRKIHRSGRGAVW